MNWKKTITMALLGLALGILLGFAVSPVLPGGKGFLSGLSFGIAALQFPALYFLLGISLALSSLKIKWWLHGAILGVIFSLHSVYSILWEVSEFGIQVTILWGILFIIMGGIIGFILEGVTKLLRF